MSDIQPDARYEPRPLMVRTLSFLIIIALGMLVFHQDIAGAVRDNSSGIFVLGTERADERFSSLCQPGNIRYYPTLVKCLEFAIDHDPGMGHELIERVGWVLFPDRGHLLNVFESRLFWVEGNYSASCAALQKAENQREMTRLAELALSLEKWDALGVYLSCIGDVDHFQVGASPHKIAELSYQMGKYYERNQKQAEALDAYLNAARWYPTPWADPVLAAASLMEAQGSREAAIQMVEDYFLRAQLPWSVFYLGRKLGDFLYEDGDQLGAYCAYRRAAQGGLESPPSQVPERLKEEVESKISMLEDSYGVTPSDCAIEP